MAFSYEQPTLHEDYIFVSSPRIFIRDYAAATVYSGQQLLAVSTPLSGWNDAGLISNVAIPVTRNIQKLQLGLPKTTRKSFELSREAQVTLTFHEMHVNTLQQLTGTTQKNVISGAPVVSQTNSGTAETTFATKEEANRFVVGDTVSFWDISGDVMVGTEVVASVTPATFKITTTGTWAVPPEATDVVMAKVGTVASYSAGAKTITLGTGEANNFVAGDRVVFIAGSDGCLAAAKAATDRVYVVSVDAGGALLNLSAAFTGTPVATNLLIGYKSIELLDPLGTIAEKSLLVFFDAVVGTFQRQVAIWYPKVTVSGSWAPDFKAGENYMDAALSFEVQSTTQITAAGTSSLVLQIPFMFD
jgi:hypothetical protein